MTRKRHERKKKPWPVKNLLSAWFALVITFAVFSALYSQHHLTPVDTPSATRRKPSSAVHEALMAFRPTKNGPVDKRILTAYLEPPISLKGHAKPLPTRTTKASDLQAIEYPDVPTDDCPVHTHDNFPIDEYPTGDPFLPWIHDYFPSLDGKSILFVAQNRRRCNTGEEHKETMTFWEPQVALFQPVPVVAVQNATGTTSYRLASSFEEATHPETRFQCHFHTTNLDHADNVILTGNIAGTEARMTFTTLSVYPFNYEYVTWRKLRRNKMIEAAGSKGGANFWLSQLLFSCPVPPALQKLLRPPSIQQQQQRQQPVRPPFYLDLVPIRTPARSKWLLTVNQTGPDNHPSITDLFDLRETFGKHHFLPSIQDSGRWANLPICPRRDLPLPPGESNSQYQEQTQHISPKTKKDRHSSLTGTVAKEVMKGKPHRFVACTWTSASYHRRGDVEQVSDSARRLEEWIHFQLLVGVDHVYVYDNSQINRNDTNNSSTPIKEVCDIFPPHQVTHHKWPCKICNNNRPGNKNPGERSSQYAAEASCRERYGPLTEWMTFLDPDEYLVPMKMDPRSGAYTWHTVLDDMDARNQSVLQFLSSRGKPRIDLMGLLEDQASCVYIKPGRGPDVVTDPCVGPKQNETFLKVYNCDFIRPPKPQRFQRAMKQIYRTSYVQSHFVHYATVTTMVAETYQDFVKANPKKYGQFIASSSSHGSSWARAAPELFLNELTEGALIHARSTLPHETMTRTTDCRVGSKSDCVVGHVCEDSVVYDDEVHGNNVFRNPDGSYCNCWRNPVVESVLAPQLEQRLRKSRK